MIFGDTGKRVINPVRASVLSGTITLQRIGDIVTITLNNIVPAYPNITLLNLGFDIPYGFRANVKQTFALVGNTGALRSHKLALFDRKALYIQRDTGWDDTPTLDGSYVGEIIFKTSDPWPDSLPGVPA